MARDFGSFHQGHVLGYSKVHEVVGFGQNEQVSCHRRLYLSEFLAEVLTKASRKSCKRPLGFAGCSPMILKH